VRHTRPPLRRLGACHSRVPRPHDRHPRHPKLPRQC
jgi:hypothetical protein